MLMWIYEKIAIILLALWIVIMIISIRMVREEDNDMSEM